MTPSSQSGGGSRISLGGSAEFQKIFENFVDLFFFFRSTKLIFRALPKHLKDPVVAKICKFVRRRKILKKKVKKGVLGAFRKILGSVSQKWIFLRRNFGLTLRKLLKMRCKTFS